jgi:enoyl-CoA hydratase/carnithine racemase
LRISTRQHFTGRSTGGIADHPLDRPDRKNPLTFESYAELRDTFRAGLCDDVNAVVIPAQRRQFLLRRRCARDHRPADQMDMKGC